MTGWGLESLSAISAVPLPAQGERDERDRLLQRALPLFNLLVLTCLAAIAVQGQILTIELAYFAASALGLVLIHLLFRAHRLGYDSAVQASLLIFASLFVERIVSLFVHGHFRDPAQSFFLPVFAALPLVYLAGFALLPEARATRLAVAYWLAVSLVTSALSWPYWSEQPLRGSLPGLMSFLWCGHALFVLLLAAMVRRQQRLAERQADLVQRERRLRQAMAEGEARFRAVFEAATVGINVTDAAGRYVMVNPCMAQMLGYAPDELLGMSVQDVTLAEDLAEHRLLAEQVLDGRLPHFHVQKHYRHRLGHLVHAEIFVRALDPLPLPASRLMCVALDITERKRAEAQAAEHRRIRDFHFEHTPLAVVEWGPDLRVRRWSQRAEQMFGWSEAEAVGCSAEQLGLFAPDQYELRRQRVARLFGGEQDHGAAIVPLRHRSGRVIWGEVRNSVIRSADGEVQTLVSMGLDITESQEMLHMLNESEARFRGIFNQAAVGIALLDASGRWLNVNHKMCEIVGYSMDELLEMDFQSITHPDDLERDLVMAQAVMDRSIDQYQVEKRYIRKDGSVVWIQLFVRRLEASSTTPARFVAVAEDIHERKLAEAQVQALTQNLEAQVAQRTAQLHEVIRAGQRRNEELTLITEMSRLLSAATDVTEAGQVVTRYLPRIFPLAQGALYLEGRRRGLFERQVHWGEAAPGAVSFTVADCWGLRSGELHHVEGEPDALHCLHATSDDRDQPHLCVPILALGAPAGLIELSWGRRAEDWAPEVPLLKTVAEKIGLSLGNLRLRAELSRQALVDPLTGLNNRRWLQTCLNDRVARHGRGGQGFAVLMIDVDHFKQINDRFGHDAGDLALQAIGRTLQRVARETEVAARLGGEEFTVLIDTDVPAEALAAGERLRQAIGAVRVEARGCELPPLSVSIGIALYPQDGRELEQVLEQADAALYAAKHRGRNQVSLRSPVEAVTAG